MEKSLLPEIMQDESNLALEECINKAFAIDLRKFMTCQTENLEDNILYEKAKQMHVLGIEGYNDCTNREEKEALIKNSIRMHRYKGTLKSIKSSITSFEFEFESWQDYDGIPNHFKIKVEKDGTMNENIFRRAIKSINENKRLSSKMDEIILNVSTKGIIRVNSTIIISHKVSI